MLTNQLKQSALLGQLDLQMCSGSSVSCLVDASQVVALVAGQAVKLVDSAQGGIPHVVACSANTDKPFGFVAYSQKDQSFAASSRVEIARVTGSVLYLLATAAFVRGVALMLDVSSPGGVITATTGKPICGYSYDKAVNVGDLVRVELTLMPSPTAP